MDRRQNPPNNRPSSNRTSQEGNEEEDRIEASFSFFFVEEDAQDGHEPTAIHLEFETQAIPFQIRPRVTRNVPYALRSRQQQQQNTLSNTTTNSDSESIFARDFVEFLSSGQSRNPSAAARNRHLANGHRAADSLVHMILDILMVSGFHPNEQSLQGQPPASLDAKQSLKVLKYLDALQVSQCPACLICQEDFDEKYINEKRVYFTPQEISQSQSNTDSEIEEERIREMPCKHVFHQKCLFKWLEMSNMCPTCRYEIMTDNPEYNQKVKERMFDRNELLKKEEELHAEEKEIIEKEEKEKNTEKSEMEKKRKRKRSQTEPATTQESSTHRYSLRSRNSQR